MQHIGFFTTFSPHYNFHILFFCCSVGTGLPSSLVHGEIPLPQNQTAAPLTLTGRELETIPTNEFVHSPDSLSINNYINFAFCS